MMATILSSFRVEQPQGSLQIVPYNGPPKHTPRKPPTKQIRSRDDDVEGNGVEAVDLTCSAKNEADCETNGIGTEKNHVSNDDPTNGQEGISMPAFQEDKEDGTRRESARSEGSNKGNTRTVDGNHSDSNSDGDSGDHHKDAGSRTGNRLEAPSISTPEYCNREVVDPSDTMNSNTVGKAKNQASELSQMRLPSSPPIGPSTTDIEPSTVEAARYIDTRVTVHQRPTESRVQSGARISTIEITSRDGSSSESSSGNKNTTSPAGKRKRVLSTSGTSRKRQNREPSTIRPADSTQPQKSSPMPEKALQCADMLELNRGSVNDDTEYEVERILASRLCGDALQYQAQWAGYETDPVWYNASNFKNSPFKLREFHEANPAVPGPPKRLSHWERCCEEDRDTEDFSDDDKPLRTARRGRRTVRLCQAVI